MLERREDRRRIVLAAVDDEVDPGRSLVRSFGVRAASLDDVFMVLTGHPAKPAAADADGCEDELEATANV